MTLKVLAPLTLTESIGEKITILDHGYVQAIEAWGCDERIIESARMSTGKVFLGWSAVIECKECNGRGWKHFEEHSCTTHGDMKEVCKVCNGAKWVKTTGDEKLLRYLYEHKHATPFEMAGLVIEVQAPIFVFREWHRHRTQCLAPDTLIHFDAPKSTSHHRYVYKLPISDLYRKWQPTIRSKRPERQTNALFGRSCIQGMRLRCSDREEILTTSVSDIIQGEPKSMVTIVTTSGRHLTATRNHKVLTCRGWMTLGEAIDSKTSLALEGVHKPGLLDRWEIPQVDESVEHWSLVLGAEDYYEISSQGRVRRKGCEPKKSTVGANGYDIVSLSIRGVCETRTVHTLVLEAFRRKKQPSEEARHLNSNKADNRVENLVWGSAADNAFDRVVSGRQQRLRVVYEEIVTVDDAGELPTYDISVVGPYHNFVAGGFVVHNSYNEMSGRYTPLPDLNYIPTVERLLVNSKSNKQAGTVKGSAELTEETALEFQAGLSSIYDYQEQLYQTALANGVPKELARVHLPVGRYSRMRASANLRNWLAFLTLRMDSAAQYEIRMYANEVGNIISQLYPRTWELFIEGKEIVK